jgi:ATP-binding cassette subfamily B protein
MASTQRIFGLLDTQIQLQDGTQDLPKSQIKGEVKFEEVSFQYNTGDRVLEKMNLNIEAGKTYALVGATGSGKSTLIKLLLRFYDPSEGKILLDGKNIQNIKLDDLRKVISYVHQDPFLFHGSVLDNIRYGSFDKTEEEVINAAKLAEASEFIENLPEGYYTVVGERGQKLSGGQRQRLAIARAVLKDSPIFIFDEATSSVDNETEAAIQRSLERITKNKTTLVVAHRLSTIVNADQIYLISNGRIKEQGAHEELLKNSGPYAHLWKVQTGGYLEKSKLSEVIQ